MSKIHGVNCWQSIIIYALTENIQEFLLHRSFPRNHFPVPIQTNHITIQISLCSRMYCKDSLIMIKYFQSMAHVPKDSNEVAQHKAVDNFLPQCPIFFS